MSSVEREIYKLVLSLPSDCSKKMCRTLVDNFTEPFGSFVDKSRYSKFYITGTDVNVV